jgi:UDP-N-acetylmuramate--alanine ligase
VALTAAIDLPAQDKAFLAEWDQVPGQVAARAEEGDVVVTMGAPPISLLGDELLDALVARVAPVRYRGRHASPADDTDPDGDSNNDPADPTIAATVEHRAG